MSLPAGLLGLVTLLSSSSYAASSPSRLPAAAVIASEPLARRRFFSSSTPSASSPPSPSPSGAATPGRMPSKLKDGQLETANSRGFDMGVPCYRIEAWIDAYDGKRPLYDLGCGYGTNARTALERRPDAKVVAVDFCDDHLQYIRAASPSTIADGRLVTMPGRLPNDISIGEGAASGILISQVIHFISPADVLQTFENASRWLAPGGTLVILCLSHYFNPWLQLGYIETILKRIKVEGESNTDSWPGWVEDLGSMNGQLGFPIPAAAPSCHTFSDKQLTALATRVGLSVQECITVPGSLSNYPDFLCISDPKSPYYGKEQQPMGDWAAAKEKGNAAYKAGNLLEAIGHFTEVDKGNASGQQHIFYSNRSAANLALGRAKEALNDACKCMEASPGFIKAYSRKGAALYRLGRFAEAAATYEQGLGLDPSNADMKKGAADARKAAEEDKVPSMKEAIEKIQVLAAKHRIETVLFLSRFLILVFASLYLLPLPWRRLTQICYRNAALASLFNYLYLLYNSHGMPRFKGEYLARVLMDPAGQYLFLAMLIFSSKPYVIALGPIVLTEGVHVLWYLGQVIHVVSPGLSRMVESQLSGIGAAFTRDPAFGALSSQKKWDLLYRLAPDYAIKCEIATGLTLLVELLTPYRNFITFFLYWQYLQMRWMLDQRDTGVRRTFKDLDGYILTLTSHPSCPALIGTGYGYIKGYMSKAVQMPEPGAARPTPKCTIM